MAAACQGTAYEAVHALLQEQESVQQLEKALQVERAEGTAASDCLVVQLLKQLTAHAESLERLQSLCSAQQKELGMAHQNIGRKRKQIQDLRSEGVFQTRRISLLEHCLHECQTICSSIAHQTQASHVVELDVSPSRAESAATSQRPSARQEVSAGHSSESGTTEEVPGYGVIEGHQAEGAQGLLTDSYKAVASLSPHTPLNSHTAVSSRLYQLPSVQGDEDGIPTNAAADDCSFGMHKFNGGPVPKRASCQILARHPEAPRSVPVICKQLTGNMLLGDCGKFIKIQADCKGSPILAPAEFEAAAGCSRGKNWKANIKVKGINGRNQMLKVWLPSLIQLVGDHVKTAVASNIPICNLLDIHSGLRIKLGEQQ